MSEIKKVIDTLDEASDGFEKVVTKSQKKIYDEAITLIKDLEVDSTGKIKQTIGNLKKLNTIKSKLKAVSENPEYVAGVSKFIEYFDALEKQQSAYFSANFGESTISQTAKEKHQLMKKIAVDNTISQLMGDGFNANVTDKMNDILLRAVTSGAKYSDLTEELHTFLQGDKQTQGALARYATTYATTAISQFTGQNNKLLTQDLDCEWFMYVGSNIETTREFCQHLTKKRYIHKSEFKDIIKGKIDDHQCQIYPKTGLPLGMIEGTNEDNLQINCGGWNCRHQLVPVSELAVPADIRAKFEKPEPKKEEPKKMQLSEDQSNKLSILENYSNEHSGKKKMATYVQQAKALIAENNEVELNILLKAAIADMNKFAASDKVKAKKKADAAFAAQWAEKTKSINEKLNALKEYQKSHNSGKIDGYIQDIEDLLDAKDESQIPQAEAIADLAIKYKKNQEAAKAYQAKKKGQVVQVESPESKQNEGFSKEQIKGAEDAVKENIEKWLKKYGYADWDSAPADHKKAKLQWEISELSSSKKYATWGVAVRAYEKLLVGVEEELKYVDIKTAYNELKAYTPVVPKNTAKYNKLVEKIGASIDAGSFDKATLLIPQAKAIKEAEESESKPVMDLYNQLSAKQISGRNATKFNDLIVEAGQKIVAGNFKAAKKLLDKAQAIVDKESGLKTINPSKNENKSKQSDHIGYGLTTDERIKKIEEQTGCDEKTAKEYNNAVNGFSYQWDYEIRKVQCGEKVTSNHGHTIEEICKRAQDLENFISKAPKWAGGRLYRGISLSPQEQVEVEKQMKAGTFAMQGTASWSTSESTARSFASNTYKTDKEGNRKSIMAIFVCDNQKNATSIKHLSSFPSENEVIASMANRYKGDGNATQKGSYVYYNVSCK